MAKPQLTINLKLDDMTHTLTLEQAKELRDILNEAVGEKVQPQYIHIPYPVPAYPTYPTWQWWTVGSVSGTYVSSIAGLTTDDVSRTSNVLNSAVSDDDYPEWAGKLNFTAVHADSIRADAVFGENYVSRTLNIVLTDN